MSMYKLYSYDVWGNSKDGFEVNDVFGTDIEISLNSDATDKEIIQELRNSGFVDSHYPTKNFEIDGELEYSLYINYNSRRMGYYRPVCELRKMEEK